jgi:hypothetical protein
VFLVVLKPFCLLSFLGPISWFGELHLGPGAIEMLG